MPHADIGCHIYGSTFTRSGSYDHQKEDRIKDGNNSNDYGWQTGAPGSGGYHTITPWIVVTGAAQLVAFMEKAFDAKEIEGSRFLNADGSIGHVEVRIGDSVVMLFDSRPEWPATPSFLRLYLADGDAVFKRALEAGATAVTQMADHFFGDRTGRVCDPAGNVWWIQTHTEDIKPEEMGRRMSGQNAFTDAMREAQTSLDRHMRSRK